MTVGWTLNFRHGYVWFLVLWCECGTSCEETCCWEQSSDDETCEDAKTDENEEETRADESDAVADASSHLGRGFKPADESVVPGEVLQFGQFGAEAVTPLVTLVGQ
ncbi:hypothetical protein F2P81_026383 [Scophthalmus maximus]|uniref:Secreted protein n=1 Tax=Scophthalmus maximus TaxID=52904 RepID=A0A6A4RRW8_SCOMX|nr:hypothetical protein F2P81_026383 [Scophthalmus maximus]